MIQLLKSVRLSTSTFFDDLSFLNSRSHLKNNFHFLAYSRIFPKSLFSIFAVCKGAKSMLKDKSVLYEQDGCF